MNKQCLLCYEILTEGEFLYHKRCSRKFFKTDIPPVLEYRYDQLGILAERIIRESVTIPGVQAKISLDILKETKGNLRFTIVGLWGRYILKPPSEKFPGLPENEDLTMKLASLFKINTVPHALIPLESGELCYITKRIDRSGNGNKICMEDMCQLTGKLTEQKYNGSYEQIAGAIKKFSSNPGFDLVTLLEVLFFSFITGNGDMHLKNFSIIETKTGFALSPAYDLLSTRLVIPEKDDPDDTALTINGKKRKLQEKDFRTFAEYCSLTAKQYENIIHKFRESLENMNSLIEKSFLSESDKEKYIEIIRGRTGRIF